MTIRQRAHIRQRQRDDDRALYQWQTPIALATALQKSRLTIYRWIASGYVERKYLSARSILVRLRPITDWQRKSGRQVKRGQ